MIALPTSPKSDSYGALRYRPPTSQKRTACSSASLSHLHIPKSELLAAALRYRTPTSSKNDRTPHQKAIAPHPPKAIAPTSPKANCLQQRFAIALPHPKSDRTPTPQKANCLQQRFAIALPHPQKAIALPHPQKRSPSHIPKSELLAAALRYRPPTSQKRSPPHIPAPSLSTNSNSTLLPS